MEGNNISPLKFIVFGRTGMGKSTLCNTLLGRDEFLANDSMNSVTTETTGSEGLFCNQPTFMIDTPGLDSSDLNDGPNFMNMVHYIKDIPDIKAFLIVISVRQLRLTASERRMLELLGSLFPGQTWYQHVAVIWTFLDDIAPQKHDSIRSIKKKGFFDLVQTWFPNLSQEQIGGIPHYFIGSHDARNPEDPSQKELLCMLGWASRLMPIQKIRIDEQIETQNREMDENDQHIEITEQRIVTRFSDGSIENGEWKEINRVTRIIPRIEPPSESIFEAAEKGHLDQIKAHIEAHTDLNQPKPTSPTNLTPLMLALQKGYELVAKELIEHGADITALNKNKLSCLSMALHNNFSVDFIEYMISHGASPVGIRNPLNTAVLYDCNIEILECLYLHGASVNHETPLCFAIDNQNIQVIEWLLMKGANVNGDCDDIPLIRAVLCNNPEIVRLLLSYRPNKNLKSDGDTALDIARRFKRNEIISLLQ